MLVEVVLGVALLLLLWQALKKPSGLPPGPWGLPLIGSVPLSFKTLQEHLRDLRRKHGNIYMWRMGTQNLVFVHDHKLVREAYNGTEFMDRPEWRLFNANEKDPLGILGSNGLVWHNNRRFALKQLKDLGMGKSKLVAAVHTQAADMVDEFKKQAGRPAPVPHAVSVAVVNIIWQMVASIQFKVTDPKYKEFKDLNDEFGEASKSLAIIDFLPWLSNIFPESFVFWLCRVDFLERAKDRFFAYFKEVVDDHRATLDRDNPRDLIDAYLIEMEKDNPDSTCSERDLYLVILDLFIAGSVTTRDTIIWMIFYLANNPRVQEKMQREIDEVLPRGTLPTLEDKPRLPYTEAVVHELLRMSSLGALIIQHMATRDTQLGGYTIPKGAVVTSVMSEIHRDTRHWDNPDDFLPERWLNKDGKFTLKKEGFMPFSVGKRQCVGEALARMELFIFTTALFQNFSFSPPAGKKFDLRPDPNNPFIHTPRVSQEVVATMRA